MSLEFTINTSLNKIGYSFAGKKVKEGEKNLIGGNLPYFIFNNKKLHWFRYPYSDLLKGNLDKTLEKFLRKFIFLEDSSLLWEMFLLSILSKYQYIGLLRRRMFLLLPGLRLTKKDVDRIMHTLGANRITFEKDITFKYRASETTHQFDFHFHNYHSLKEDELIDSDVQNTFLNDVKLDVNNREDEMCLVGLISGRNDGVNEWEYLGYIRTKGKLPGDENRMRRRTQERISIKGKEVEDIGIIRNKSDVGYGMDAGKSFDFSLPPFSLFKIVQNVTTENYVELKWGDIEKQKIGVYCPEYIRRILGPLP